MAKGSLGPRHVPPLPGQPAGFFVERRRLWIGLESFLDDGPRGLDALCRECSVSQGNPHVRQPAIERERPAEGGLSVRPGLEPEITPTQVRVKLSVRHLRTRGQGVEHVARLAQIAYCLKRIGQPDEGPWI